MFSICAMLFTSFDDMVHWMQVGNLCCLPLTKPNTCHKFQVTSFLPKKQKVPAATGKTSPRLIHVIKFQERHSGRKKAPAAAGKTSPSLLHVKIDQTDLETLFDKQKSRLRQPGRPHQACYLSKNLRNVFSTDKKMPAADLTKLTTCQKVLETHF